VSDPPTLKRSLGHLIDWTSIYTSAASALSVDLGILVSLRRAGAPKP